MCKIKVVTVNFSCYRVLFLKTPLQTVLDRLFGALSERLLFTQSVCVATRYVAFVRSFRRFWQESVDANVRNLLLTQSMGASGRAQCSPVMLSLGVPTA